ncbi:MAG TPA: hypothetical protein VNX21_08305 [Candidatus Thermoplasmatota archaeon]|nr:hypothetical protein [Candidatus Thermoplasmatota archaeon]
MHALAGWLPLRWLVLLHVLGAFAFFLVHGVSAAVLLRLRSEREPAAVAALLRASGAANGWTWAAWGLLALTGGLLAATLHAWREPWVWGSVVVLVVVTGLMSPLAARAFNEARHAAGLPWFDGKGVRPAGPVDPVALEAALATIRRRALPVTLLGAAGAVALVWLMVMRPG